MTDYGTLGHNLKRKIYGFFEKISIAAGEKMGNSKFLCVDKVKGSRYNINKGGGRRSPHKVNLLFP